MSYFDIILLALIGVVGLYGLWKGIVYQVVSIVGTIAAIILATRFYAPVSDWLINLTHWNPNFSKVIIFIIVFIVINRLVVFVFYLINKFLSAFTHLPIIHSVDKLFGLIFGLLEASIALGILFFFIARFPIGDMLMGLIQASKIVPYLVKMASIFLPLIPEALSALRSTIEGLL